MGTHLDRLRELLRDAKVDFEESRSDVDKTATFLTTKSHASDHYINDGYMGSEVSVKFNAEGVMTSWGAWE